MDGTGLVLHQLSGTGCGIETGPGGVVGSAVAKLDAMGAPGAPLRAPRNTGTSCKKEQESKGVKEWPAKLAADVKKEISVLVRSLKSSILSSTSFQKGKTFWGVVSAAVVQSRRKANMVAWGDGKFGP